MIDIAIPRVAAEPRATVLVLRCCRGDRVASKGFVWPESGPVACDDWSPEVECGHGLHGWLWGAGDLNASNGSHSEADAKWLVVQVDAALVVDLGGKAKFPRGEVVYCGDRDTAVRMVAARAPAGIAALYGTATAGDYGTATAGDHGTISIEYWCPKRNRWRRAIAEVGENGIEPNTAYVLDENNKFAKKPATGWLISEVPIRIRSK